MMPLPKHTDIPQVGLQNPTVDSDPVKARVVHAGCTDSGGSQKGIGGRIDVSITPFHSSDTPHSCNSDKSRSASPTPDNNRGRRGKVLETSESPSGHSSERYSRSRSPRMKDDKSSITLSKKDKKKAAKQKKREEKRKKEMKKDEEKMEVLEGTSNFRRERENNGKRKRNPMGRRN